MLWLKYNNCWIGLALYNSSHELACRITDIRICELSLMSFIRISSYDVILKLGNFDHKWMSYKDLLLETCCLRMACDKLWYEVVLLSPVRSMSIAQSLSIASTGTLRRRLVIHYHMMTSSNGNIFHVTCPLCGEFTGPGEFPTQRPVTRSFDVFFDLRLNNRSS